MDSSHKLAMTSAETGLDFACSLISNAISAEGKAKPEKAPQLLHELSSYVQFRYVGELELALEYLGGLAIFAHRLLSEASNFGLSFVGSLRK
jgi:hypothetical protein